MSTHEIDGTTTTTTTTVTVTSMTCPNDDGGIPKKNVSHPSQSLTWIELLVDGYTMRREINRREWTHTVSASVSATAAVSASVSA